MYSQKAAVASFPRSEGELLEDELFQLYELEAFRRQVDDDVVPV